MFGTGYFPLGEESAYHLEKDNLYLTGTAEVGAVSIHVNETFDEADLPLRYAGISPCFAEWCCRSRNKRFYECISFKKSNRLFLRKNG